MAKIFDYYNSNIWPKPTEKWLLKRFKEVANDRPIYSYCRNKYQMYEIDTCLSTGTIIPQNIIPLEYLHCIEDLYEFGEMVDTDGYRGLGIYIKDRHHFKKTSLDEYYPIIKLRYHKERGYCYYMNFITLTTVIFENIKYYPRCGSFGYEEHEEQEDGEKASIFEYFKVTNTREVEYYYNGNWITLTKDGKGLELPYPFENNKQANEALRFAVGYNVKLYSNLYKGEILRFDTESKRIYIIDAQGQKQHFVA